MKKFVFIVISSILLGTAFFVVIKQTLEKNIGLDNSIFEINNATNTAKILDFKPTSKSEVAPISTIKKVYKLLDKLNSKNLNNNLETVEIYNDINDKRLAYSKENEETHKWSIYVNEIKFKNLTIKKQEYVLIHEFAHILTLNSTHLEFGYIYCDTTVIWDGCAGSDSPVYNFNNKFWGQNTDKIDTNYVSDYAKSNIYEDIAETVAVYVTTKYFDTYTGIQEEKLMLIHNNEELRNIRENYLRK